MALRALRRPSTYADRPVLLAIPESEVLRDPAVIRGTVCLWRLHGYEVLIVTHAHREEVQAVLGDRAEYVDTSAPIDGAVWVSVPR